MYGQMQNPASAAKWVFFGLFGIVLMGVLLGADITNATWLNPEIASAQALSLQIEARHQERTYQLQEQLAQAQTEAEIKVIEREQALLDAQYQHDIQALQQDLEHRDIAFKTWMTILAFMGGTLSVAILLVSMVWIIAAARNTQPRLPAIPTAPAYTPPMQKKIVSVPERNSYEPLYQQRLTERMQEITGQREVGEMAMRMKAVTDPARMSRDEYNKRPLAGD